MKYIKGIFIAFGIFALSCVGSVQASTSTPAFGFSGGGLYITGDITLGYQFTVNSATKVTELGWFDYNNDGLGFSHQIGIWNSGGTLLDSLVLGSGTSGTLESGFRYESLTSSLVLSAGTYILAGNSGSEIYSQDATGINLTGLVSLGNAVRSNFAGFGLPNVVDGTDNAGYFGPNMKVSAVPIPASLPLLLAALGGLGFVARRRNAA